MARRKGDCGSKPRVGKAGDIKPGRGAGQGKGIGQRPVGRGLGRKGK